MDWWVWEEFLGIEAKIDFNTSLTIPSSTKGFVIYSDAFKKGLRCVLLQNGKVITYASR